MFFFYLSAKQKLENLTNHVIIILWSFWQPEPEPLRAALLDKSPNFYMSGLLAAFCVFVCVWCSCFDFPAALYSSSGDIATMTVAVAHHQSNTNMTATVWLIKSKRLGTTATAMLILQPYPYFRQHIGSDFK